MAYGEFRVHPAALGRTHPDLQASAKPLLSPGKREGWSPLAILLSIRFMPRHAMGAALDLGAETFQVLLPHGRPWSERDSASGV